MKSMSLRRLALLAATSTVFVCQFAQAQATGGPSAGEATPPGSTRPPEQQAIDACAGKSQGDRVQFTDSKGKKRKWVCVTVNGVLAARSGIATAARPKKP